MSSVKEKVLNWFGLEEEYDEEFGTQPAVSEARAESQLVGVPSAKGPKVVVCEPTTLEEAQAIADCLKSRKQVIVNLETTSIEISKKIIDFVSGATYGVDGKSQQIGSKVFLFVPAGVEITPEGPSFYALPGILKSGRE